MNHRLVSFIVFTWLFGTLFSLLLEGAFMGDDQSSVLNNLTIFNRIEQTGEGGVVEFAKSIPGFLSAFLGMLVWDYSYLQGPLSIIRYILMTISIGFVATLIALSISAVQGVFSAARGLFG